MMLYENRRVHDILDEYIGKKKAYALLDEVFDTCSEIIEKLQNSKKVLDMYVVQEASILFLLSPHNERMYELIGTNDKAKVLEYVKKYIDSWYRDYQVDKGDVGILVEVDKLKFRSQLRDLIEDYRDVIEVRASSKKYVLLMVGKAFESDILKRLDEDAVKVFVVDLDIDRWL